MSFYPQSSASQGISRAELEEEFFQDEQEDTTSSRSRVQQVHVDGGGGGGGNDSSDSQQLLDPLSSYRDPLSIYYNDPLSGTSYGNNTPTGQGRERSHYYGLDDEDEPQSGESNSISALTQTIFNTGDVSSAGPGRSRRSRPSPRNRSRPTTTRPTSPNRAGVITPSTSGGSGENNNNNNNNKTAPRGYARTGPYGRSFNWPVLLCIIVAGPLLVLLSKKDEEHSSLALNGTSSTPLPSAAATTSTLAPTSNIFSRPSPTQPSATPTTVPQPTTVVPTSVSPTLAPTTVSPWTPAVVDWVLEGFDDEYEPATTYMVHAPSSSPVEMTIRIVAGSDQINNETTIAVYPQVYLPIGSTCGNATQEYSLSFSNDDDDNNDNVTTWAPNATTTSNGTAPDQDFVMISMDLLNTIDTTVALCIDDTVVAASYHLFPNVTSGQEEKSIATAVVDFTFLTNETETREMTVKPETLLLLMEDWSSGTTNTTNATRDESLTFWSSNALYLEVGDACPTNATTLLQDQRTPFPVTLHLVTMDQVIFACVPDIDMDADVIVAQIFVSMEYVASDKNSTVTLLTEITVPTP